jgi:hypothetical protein
MVPTLKENVKRSVHFIQVSKGQNSHLPIPDAFKPLIKKIVQFNKKKNKIKKK